jgi:hypothetical protein
VYQSHQYPPASGRPLSFERNLELIETAKQQFEERTRTAGLPTPAI